LWCAPDGMRRHKRSRPVPHLVVPPG
jgi:hypothetical protein